ncbi:MAG: DNA-processing protein DprA [Clostridiales bacterium]|nr:DNA-processing protein DprA [Clostridiales bacterium]
MKEKAGQQWEIERGAPGYPSALEDLSDPPARLYGFGNPALMSTDSLAIVGARRATPYGLACTRLFAGWSASRGITVVSGAAIGCDCAAHEAALASNGPTVAVLPCGADVNYPPSAYGLLSLLRVHAVVVSEFPWNAPPARWTFVKRNRLIAALGRALLVTEAGLPSGTFTTADFALELGRDVFAVPGSILSPESRGSNRLISQGAQPMTDVSELAGALGRETIPETFAAVSGNQILSALRATPMRPDDIARECVMDIIEVVHAITLLELKGSIKRYPDGRYGAVKVT